MQPRVPRGNPLAAPPARLPDLEVVLEHGRGLLEGIEVPLEHRGAGMVARARGHALNVQDHVAQGKIPKSIGGERRDPPWRVTPDEAIDQQPLQPLHSRAQPRVSLPPHAMRTRDRIHYRARAAEPLPDPIGLQKRPSLPAPALALVNGISAAGPTEVAGEPLEQPCHPSLAVRTMQPGPKPAEVAACPGYADALWNRLTAQFKQDETTFAGFENSFD
jgi:hypothetical protein